MSRFWKRLLATVGIGVALYLLFLAMFMGVGIV